MSPEPASLYPSSGGVDPFSNGRRRPLGLDFSERRLLLLIGDLSIVSLALWGALWLRRGWLEAALQKLGRPFSVRLYWWLVLWAIWLFIATVMQCYDLRRAARAGQSAVYTMTAALGSCGLYLLVPFVSAPLVYSRLAWFIFSALALVGVGLWRIAYASVFHQPVFTRRVLVVGAGGAGRALVKAIASLKVDPVIHLAGFADDNPALTGSVLAGYPVLGRTDSLPTLIGDLGVNELVLAITDSGSMSKALVEQLVHCWSRGVKIVPMALFYEEVVGALPVEHLGQNLFALVAQETYTPRRIWALIRRLLDLAVATVGLLITLILLPLLALLIYVDSRGPIFYRQQRVGLGGELFWIYKLRSMVPDAESGDAVWATEDDPRVTRMGRLMRRARIDEWPQFWNLLVGNMSLIGPRPERPEFVRQLAAQLPYYAIRHSIKPGLTGWAQVRYRYGNTVADAMMKLEFDLYYVKHRGPVLDAAILLSSIRVVLTMAGT